jgi:hypothetical protein
MPEKKKKPVDLAAEGAAQVATAGGELVGTTIKLTRDVWQAAKIETIKRGVTLAGIIENALRQYLEETEKEGSKEPPKKKEG